MNLKKRSTIQITIFVFTILISLTYSLYLKDLINFKLLSFGDLNPYGGWSELKSAFTDVGYRFSGISKSTALTSSILLTSLFFGRFFCGFICPIGALQDFFTFIGNRLNIKKIAVKNKIHKKLILLKYFVFISALVLSIFGLGRLISPYSPWLAFLNISMGLSFTLGTYILITILVLSLVVPRIFCRYLCPLGAFQSLWYAAGFFKVKNSSNCKSCNYCLKECPVEIKSPHESREVSPECINCLKCVDTTCIRDDYTYSINIFNRELNKNKYIAFSLIIFISIYSFLPLIDTSAGNQDISNFGALKDGSYIGTGIGFGGPLRIELTVDNGNIENIEVVNHRESTGYYEEVFKMKRREIIENQSLSIDTVSGATATSRGFFSAVKSAVSQSLEYNE
jgi:uncharacterized protein with FMN-binding domain